MAKKKFPRKNSLPEFKPGDKPYLEYDGVILNANVPWNEIVTDIKEKHYSLSTIAAIAEATLGTLKAVLKQNYDSLPFRSGARLLTLHNRLYPQCYLKG